MKSKIFNVSLARDIGKLSYPIIVGDDLLPNSGEILRDFLHKKKIIVIHDNFFSINDNQSNPFVQFIQSIKKLSSSIKLIDVSGGDQTKNIEQLNQIIEKVLTYKIDRQSIIVAFGGGVIGDIAGCAATML